MLRLAVLGLCLVLAHAEAVAAESCPAVCETVSPRMDDDDKVRLEARIAALEARIAMLEAAPSGADVPDDETMERVMALTERMIRRFYSMVREMKGEAEGEEL